MADTHRNIPTRTQMKALMESDPVLGAAIKRLPPFPGFPAPKNADSHFHSLARTIIHQQLAGKAATTIHNRVAALSPGNRFPKPEEITRMRSDRLRKAGLSAAKMKSIKELAKAASNGQLRLQSISRCEDGEIIERLTRVTGIGVWSAQMFMMFRLGRLNVLPSGDLGIQEGLRILDGLPTRPKPRELDTRGECWKPLQSVAAWYMYRVVDEYRASST